MGSIISFIPDPLFFIACIVLALILYRFLPDDVKPTIKNAIKTYGIYIVLIIMWIYFKKKWGLVGDDLTRWPANIYYATFIVFLILGIWHLGRLLLYEQRYYTDMFICNGVAGSCARRQDIGDWTVFAIGTSGSSDEKFVLPFPSPQKIVVVPKDAWQYVGSNMVCTTEVFSCDILDIPEDVAHYIQTQPMLKGKLDKIYFGIWSEELRTNDPDVDVIESNFKKANSRINELATMLKGKLGHTKAFINDTMGMTDKLKGKSKFSNPQQRQENLE